MSAKENKVENEMMEEIPAIKDSFGGLKETDAFETWRDRDSNGVQTDSQEVVFTGFPINVQRFEVEGQDGKKYNSYGIAFSTLIRGNELVQKMFLVPPHNDSMIYNTLAQIFGESDLQPLEIVKTTTVRNNRETVNYTMRVSTKDDFGSDIVCTLFPSGRGDRVVFLNLVEVLKKRGLLS